MKARTVFFALGASALFLAGTSAVASAQAGGWRASGHGRATVRATSRPPAPREEARPPIVHQGTSLLNPLAYRVPIAVVPAILMSDGSMYANFGYGYEPIARICGGATMGAVVASNGVVLQPAPTQRPVSQLTPSMLIQSGYIVHNGVVSDMGRLACFNHDRFVYVYR